MMNVNISPVILSIVLNRFDICMHLLSLGADINYKMMDRSGTIKCYIGLFMQT